LPGLFDSYSLRGVTLRNRIVVSPMCQYMAREGVANEWHQAHYASLARGGAGLVIVEATAVSPEGRISWGDLGLWNDEQAEALKPIVASIKAAGAVPGIQIGHAGRKASANRPWEGDDHIPLGQPNSWETMAASAVPFGAGLPRVPREMSVEEIQRVQQAMVRAAERARDLGFEWIQLHFAHGYLAQSFFSPLANQRTDEYGGSPENRNRYLLKTFQAVRKVWPAERPLTARLGVIEFYEGDEALRAQAVSLLAQMKAGGLDFADISIGFNTPLGKVPWGENFMVPFAKALLAEVGLPGTTSWYLARDPKGADALIREGHLDLVSLGRPLLDDPHWPYHAAKALGVERAEWVTLPPAYAHWLARYR